MDSEPPPAPNQNHLQSVLGKRKAPTDKNTKCEVCGDKVERATFGVSTCKPCTNFFDRHIRKATPSPLICRRGENCEITPKTRAACPSCRLEKCEQVGMREIPTKTKKRVQLFCKVCDGKTPFEMACGRCRNLFSRLFGMPMKVCEFKMECKITHQTRMNCPACFYDNCLAAGLTSADIRPPPAQSLQSPESFPEQLAPATVPTVQYPVYQEVVIPVPKVVVQLDDGPCKLCRRKPTTKPFEPFNGVQMCRRCTLVVTKNTTDQPLDICRRGDGDCRQKFLIVHCFACLFTEYQALKGGIVSPTTVPQEKIVTGLCNLCDKPAKNIPHKLFNGIQMCRRCSLFIRQLDECQTGEPLEECSKKYEECKNHFPVVNCLACIYKRYKELMEPEEVNPEKQALATVPQCPTQDYNYEQVSTVWKRGDNGTYYCDVNMKGPTTVTQTVSPGSSYGHPSNPMISGVFPQMSPNQRILTPDEERDTVPEMYQYQGSTNSSVMSNTGRSQYVNEEPEPEMCQYRPIRIPKYSESPDIVRRMSEITSSKTHCQLGEHTTPKTDSDQDYALGIDKIGSEMHHHHHHHHPKNSIIPLLDAGQKPTIPTVNSDHDDPIWDTQLDKTVSLESYLNTFDPMESPLK